MKGDASTALIVRLCQFRAGGCGQGLQGYTASCAEVLVGSMTDLRGAAGGRRGAVIRGREAWHEEKEGCC